MRGNIVVPVLLKAGKAKGKEIIPLYVASMRMQVTGRISSYTRANLFSLTSDGVDYIYNTDFSWDRDDNMTWTEASRDLFYSNGSDTEFPIDNNQTGYSWITFPPDTIYKIDSLTVEGRTDVASTQFGFTFYNQFDNVLAEIPMQFVTDLERLDVGIDLPIPDID